MDVLKYIKCRNLIHTILSRGLHETPGSWYHLSYNDIGAPTHKLCISYLHVCHSHTSIRLEDKAPGDLITGAHKDREVSGLPLGLSSACLAARLGIAAFQTACWVPPRGGQVSLSSWALLVALVVPVRGGRVSPAMDKGLSG